MEIFHRNVKCAATNSDKKTGLSKLKGFIKSEAKNFKLEKNLIEALFKEILDSKFHPDICVFLGFY